jgi:hypothetical protein
VAGAGDTVFGADVGDFHGVYRVLVQTGPLRPMFRPQR